MGGFDFTPPAAVDQLESRHCTGAFVSSSNNTSECCVAERPLQQYGSIGTSIGNRLFGKSTNKGRFGWSLRVIPESSLRLPAQPAEGISMESDSEAPADRHMTVPA